MEFFGLTRFGVSDPIKFLMRPDYKEPATSSSLVQKIQKGEYNRPIAELIRDVDVYSSGTLDGYAYKSHDRLTVTRNRRFCKPVGPKQMYRDSVCGSMDYGWFINDPSLKDKTWYKQDVFLPKPSSAF